MGIYVDNWKIRVDLCGYLWIFVDICGYSIQSYLHAGRPPRAKREDTNNHD